MQRSCKGAPDNHHQTIKKSAVEDFIRNESLRPKIKESEKINKNEKNIIAESIYCKQCAGVNKMEFVRSDETGRKLRIYMIYRILPRALTCKLEKSYL